MELFSLLHGSPGSPGLSTPDGLFLSLPDTLEVVEGEPTAWYFTNKAHEVKRKHSWKLDDLRALKKKFARPHAGDGEDLVMASGIAGTWCTWEEVRHGIQSCC